MKYLMLAAATLLSSGATAVMADENHIFVKGHAGLSLLQDQKFSQSGVTAAGATGKGAYDAGFGYGGAVGYRFDDKWSAELGWDYRNNGVKKTTFSNGVTTTDGDYASNLFSLNGYYRFESWETLKARPYIGAGVVYREEVDMDLKIGPTSRSYSTTGKSQTGFQLIGGMEKPLSDNIDLFFEARYLGLGKQKLKAETGTGEITNIKYNPVSLNIGVTYKF